MNIIFQIMKGLFEAILNLLGYLTGLIQPKSDHELSASFGNPRKVLRRNNKGFCIGDKALDRETSHKNLLVIGQTGAGKTTRAIIQSAINLTGSSLIINDAAGGELYQLTAGFFKEEGYDIKVISFSNSSISDGFNPFSRATASDINQVVSTLMKAGMGADTGDSFWLNSAQSLVVLIFHLLKSIEPQYCNIANVLHVLTMLAGEPENVDYLYSKYASKTIFQRYKATIAQSDRTLSGIVSSAQAALMIYQNPEIAMTTAFDSINFASLRKRETVIYIQNPILDQEFLAPITTVFFNQLFASLMQKLPSENERDIFCLIDEAATFKLNWALILSQVRKFRIGCCLAIQTFDQFVAAYKHHGAETIRNNCYSSLQFSNMPLTSARDLEQILGKYNYEDDKGIKRIRSLMSPDELRQMDEAILMVGNNAPFLINPKPWFKSRFKRKVGLPAPPKKSKIPFDVLPLLSVDFKGKC